MPSDGLRVGHGPDDGGVGVRGLGVKHQEVRAALGPV